MTTRWRGIAPNDYEWREWASEAVVFVHATGDTHALSAEASAVLGAMRVHPDEALTPPEWLTLAGYASDSDDVELDETIMQGLLTIGLVRRDAP